MRSRWVMAGVVVALVTAASISSQVVARSAPHELVLRAGAPAGPMQPAPPTTAFHSQQLPVTVTPSTGLVDNQRVTVHISGFPANDTVAAVECSSDALSQGAQACEIGNNEVIFQTAADGTATTQFTVTRMLQPGPGATIDCDSAPNRCLIGVGALNDYSVSGGAPISFKPGLPPVPRPVAVVFPSIGLRDQQGVELLVANLTPGKPVEIMECQQTAGTNQGGTFNGGLGCQQLGYLWTTPSNGIVQMTLPVSASLFNGFAYSCAGPQECPPGPTPQRCAGAPGAPVCTIIVQQYSRTPQADPVPIHFAN